MGSWAVYRSSVYPNSKFKIQPRPMLKGSVLGSPVRLWDVTSWGANSGNPTYRTDYKPKLKQRVTTYATSPRGSPRPQM